jgi:hypothetical protein
MGDIMKQIRFSKEDIEQIILDLLKDEHGSENIELFSHTSGVTAYIKEEE